MAVSAAVDEPAVSRCKPTVAAPVPEPSSDEVKGDAVLTQAALMEDLPASALLPRSGSAELPPLDAEDLGVALKQRSNSVQVRFAWRLPLWQGWHEKVPSAGSAFDLRLVPRSPSAEGSKAM